MLAILVLLVCVNVVLSALPAPYVDCGGTAEVHSIVLSPDPCAKNTNPCDIYVDTTYTGQINFTAHSTYAAAESYAVGIHLGDNPLDFYIERDACASSVSCPIHAGYSVIYSGQVHVPSQPDERVAAKWYLKDKNSDELIICFVFPVFVHAHGHA